jgi:hypothetical protein
LRAKQHNLGAKTALVNEYFALRGRSKARNPWYARR